MGDIINYQNECFLRDVRKLREEKKYLSPKEKIQIQRRIRESVKDIVQKIIEISMEEKEPLDFFRYQVYIDFAIELKEKILIPRNVTFEELLERKINIPASEYRFKDKKKFQYGFTTDKGVKKVGTAIKDLIELADSYDNFEEEDITQRNNKILNEFYGLLKENHLFKE